MDSLLKESCDKFKFIPGFAPEGSFDCAHTLPESPSTPAGIKIIHERYIGLRRTTAALADHRGGYAAAIIQDGEGEDY